MQKDTRVRIVKGRKGKGQTGTVFWTGPDKFGDGDRCGVRGDDGETYWVNEEYLEEIAEGDPGFDAPAEPVINLEKGDHVSYEVDGETGTGVIFWIGESKSGALRVGLRDDETDEAVWTFANRVKPADAGEDEEPAPRKTTRKKTKKKKAAKKKKKKKKKKQSGDDAQGDLVALGAGELFMMADEQPYAVFVEVERRLADEGRSPALKRVAKAAGGAISDKLLSPDNRDDIVDACMEFGAELGFEIFIDDEPEEGVTQAMEELERRLKEF